MRTRQDEGMFMMAQLLAAVLLLLVPACDRDGTNVPSPSSESGVAQNVRPGPGAASGPDAPLSSPTLNTEGWPLPDVTAFEVTRTRSDVPVPLSGAVDTVELVVTEFRPVRDTLIRTERLYCMGAEETLIEPQMWLVVSVAKFEIGDRPFCYLVRASRAAVDPKTGTALQVASSAVLCYSDEKGDGRFTRLEYLDTGNPSPRPRVPAWVIEYRKSARPED